MYSMIREYVRSCDTCARSKNARHKPFGMLLPLPLPHRPWTAISMDFIVKLPRSRSFDSVLVVVDRFTKMAHFIPCKESCTSAELANLVFAHVFKLHGLPDSIVSDRGPQFVSKFWKHLLQHLQIERNLSSARHPESDGQTERVNQILEQYLRCFVDSMQTNWSSLLPMAEFAYNNSFHSSSGFSPFYSNYGFHPRFDLGNTATTPNPSTTSYLDAISQTNAHLKKNLQRAVQRMKFYADRQRQQHPPYKPGDSVWLVREGIKSKRPCEKLTERKIGPFVIKR